MHEDKDLVYWNNPVLREVCKPVEAVDESVRALARRMFEVMYAHKGVGLAAPQVGVALRLFVVNCGEGTPGEHVLINPEILETSGSETDQEGCLSFPDIRVKVARPTFARVKAMDLSGEWKVFEGGDLLARCYLHENDHLNGVLLIDKMGPLQKLNWKKTLARLEREEADRRKGRKIEPAARR